MRDVSLMLQDASFILLVSASCILLLSFVLILIKQTRRKAILLFVGSVLFFGAVVRLYVFRDMTGYFLFFFPADALIIASAVMGLLSHYKTPKTRAA